MDENQNMHTDPVTGEPVMEPAFPDPAAPMQEMIPTQTDAPEGDTVAEGEIPEVPEDSAVIGGAFYGDPHAPNFHH